MLTRNSRNSNYNNLPVRAAFSVMDQYNSRTAIAEVGEPNPLESITVNYDSHLLTRKERMH